MCVCCVTVVAEWFWLGISVRSSEIKMTIFDEYVCGRICFVRAYASVKHKSRFIVYHREKKKTCFAIVLYYMCMLDVYIMYLASNVRKWNSRRVRRGAGVGMRIFLWTEIFVCWMVARFTILPFYHFTLCSQDGVFRWHSAHTHTVTHMPTDEHEWWGFCEIRSLTVQLANKWA